MIAVYFVVAAFLYWPLKKWVATAQAPAISALLWPLMLLFFAGTIIISLFMKNKENPKVADENTDIKEKSKISKTDSDVIVPTTTETSPEAFYILAYSDKVESIKVIVNRSKFGPTLDTFLDKNFPGTPRLEVGHALTKEIYKNLLLDIEIDINIACSALGCLLDGTNQNIVFVTKDEIKTLMCTESDMDYTLQNSASLLRFIDVVMGREKAAVISRQHPFFQDIHKDNPLPSEPCHFLTMSQTPDDLINKNPSLYEDINKAFNADFLYNMITEWINSSQTFYGFNFDDPVTNQDIEIAKRLSWEFWNARLLLLGFAQDKYLGYEMDSALNLNRVNNRFNFSEHSKDLVIGEYFFCDLVTFSARTLGLTKSVHFTYLGTE